MRTGKDEGDRVSEQNRPGPKGFIAVDPYNKGSIVEIPLESNKSWLTLFYALPEELVAKASAYLDFPRCPYEVLRTDKYEKLINDDMFLLLVWDCTAWAVWQYFEVPNLKTGEYQEIPSAASSYSGDFPIWRLSYLALPYIRLKLENHGFSFQSLFNMPQNMSIPYLSYDHFGNLIGNLTTIIVEEQNWQPIIDEAWRNRSPADFSEYRSNAKSNFMRSWDHGRTKAGRSLSLDALSEQAHEASSLFDVPDPLAEFESSVMDSVMIEEFKASLSEQDMQILKLKSLGYTYEEIASQVGFKTHSAVVKRFKKITDQYEEFVSKQYEKYLETF